MWKGISTSVTWWIGHWVRQSVTLSSHDPPKTAKLEFATQGCGEPTVWVACAFLKGLVCIQATMS